MPRSTSKRVNALKLISSFAFLNAISQTASAQDSGAALDTGDTAWIIVATALVLFMTLPALALFYGGLVRTKNVLSVLMQCLIITCVMSLIWVVCGYSLAFDSSQNVTGEVGLHSFIGGTSKIMLNGIGPDTLSGTIPEILFVAFQMTFAAITPALMIGAFCERMKFSAIIVFSALWLVL